MPKKNISSPISKQDVKKLVLAWFDKQAQQARVVDFFDIIAEHDFELRAVGAADNKQDIVFRGYAGLEDHQRGKLVFFDQKFQLKSIDKIAPQSEQTIAYTTSIWQTRTWKQFDAYSILIKALVKHQWVIIRSRVDQRPVILKHICTVFKYFKGYAPSDQKVSLDFHLTQKTLRK